MFLLMQKHSKAKLALPLSYELLVILLTQLYFAMQRKGILNAKCEVRNAKLLCYAKKVLESKVVVHSWYMLLSLTFSFS